MGTHVSGGDKKWYSFSRRQFWFQKGRKGGRKKEKVKNEQIASLNNRDLGICRTMFKAVIHSNQKTRTTQAPDKWIAKMWYIVLSKIGM